MTANVIAQVTEALQERLEAAVGLGQVWVGPPVAEDVGNRSLALFLFHIVPNRDLRNQEHFVTVPRDPTGPLVKVDSLTLDLRYLLSVFRSAGFGGGMADPNELLTLGAAVRALHENPVIGGSRIPHQQVRITPEPYPMEELSRVWGLFPQTSYRTSMVYLVSPVSVSLDPPRVGPPVAERIFRQGQFTEPSGPSIASWSSGVGP